MTADIFDDRPCALGEGPLWHPARGELFWFDIMAKTLHSRAASWTFPFTVSAAGWIDARTLLLASDHALLRFDIETGETEHAVPLEADNPITRSNDGRADPWGGFWIGTMGRNAEDRAGAIYRFHKGTLRTIAPGITISNAICFTPDQRFAHYTDTATQQIMRVALDPGTGWPNAAPQVWADLTGTELNPDGAIIDAAGTMWLACWGAGAVVCLDANGRETARHPMPGLHTTCPAFGGEDLTDLYVTSATEGLSAPLGDNGKTAILRRAGKGQREHQVLL